MTNRLTNISSSIPKNPPSQRFHGARMIYKLLQRYPLVVIGKNPRGIAMTSFPTTRTPPPILNSQYCLLAVCVIGVTLLLIPLFLV